MTYNYRQAVKSDIEDYITSEGIDLTKYADVDEAFEDLVDQITMSDSVTGNASGSYTFSTWKAEENLLHNWDLVEEAAECFGYEPTIGTGWKNGAEWWDVIIRIYLADGLLYEVLSEMMS